MSVSASTSRLFYVFHFSFFLSSTELMFDGKAVGLLCMKPSSL